VTLARNRGKGGAVTHGLRHARGEFALFADADGASRFDNLAKLLVAARTVSMAARAVAVGSRAHMVGSDAVVRRSALRNALMRFFHVFLTKLTPPATSRVRDTQCGFKLFSRAALPHIVPFMRSEGWIFDIEMLMLAESAPAAPILQHQDDNWVHGGCQEKLDGEEGDKLVVVGSSPGINVVEVPIEWHEVEGSKLNVVKDSIAMAVGLIMLRATWLLGIYERRNL
jgi:dolichyl-phosphate beta-glucosyltransferase